MQERRERFKLQNCITTSPLKFNGRDVCLPDFTSQYRTLPFNTGLFVTWVYTCLFPSLCSPFYQCKREEHFVPKNCIATVPLKFNGHYFYLTDSLLLRSLRIFFPSCVGAQERKELELFNPKNCITTSPLKFNGHYLYLTDLLLFPFLPFSLL